MDPRPSRRADQQYRDRMAEWISSQWILGRVVALTGGATVVEAMEDASQWILGRVVALTPATNAEQAPYPCLNGSSAESSR